MCAALLLFCQMLSKQSVDVCEFDPMTNPKPSPGEVPESEETTSEQASKWALDAVVMHMGRLHQAGC